MPASQDKPRDILAGVYKHYKGEYYLVLGLAHHSETEERLVIYVPLYTREGPRIAARPLDMFFEEVEIDGTKKPRFEYVGSELSDSFAK